MRTDELVGEIEVCSDCMMIHANGEYDGDPDDRPADLPEPWSLWGFGYHATMGGTHEDGCVNGPDGTRDEDCDCERTEFSWSACEGCGSNLGGSRYRFTMWRATREYALITARQFIGLARDFRRDNVHTISGYSAANYMAVAGEWRAYLAAIAASDRRFRLSMARMSAERAA